MKWFDRLIILGIYIPELNLTNFLGGKVADMSSALILKKTPKKEKKEKNHPMVVAQAVELKQLVLQNNCYLDYRVTILDVELLWERLQEAWLQNKIQAGLGMPAGGIRADGSGRA